MINFVTNKLLLSASLVSLSASFSNSIQHRASVTTSLKSFLFEVFCPQRAAKKRRERREFLCGSVTDFLNNENDEDSCKLQI
jgi:hypothetical protein